MTDAAQAAAGAGLEGDAYWKAAAEGVLLLRHCLDCGQPHHYPRNHCPFCFSTRLEDRPSSGAGEIYSYSIVRIGPNAPYALAYVTIDEGVSILTNIVDCDLEMIAIGDRVEPSFAATSGSEDKKVPLWRKTTASPS